uniref:aralkylamine N-acetyltransferase n=1 Tax=Setaria digitata TaxID=48799 RepID=A0A915PUL6_9BILA
MADCKQTEIDGFKLIQLCVNDINEMMEYLMKHFIPNEPTARSVGMSRNGDGWFMTKAIVEACLEFPYSYTLKNENNEIVAVRMATVLQRPKSEKNQARNLKLFSNFIKADGIFLELMRKDEQCNSESEKLPESEAQIAKLTGVLESKIWDLVPSSTVKLLEYSIISTNEKYTGRGLMIKLLTFDLEEQKNDGIQGAISEATAYNSQKLFAKLGYQMLYEIKYSEWLDKNGKQIFKCDDCTNCAQLVYRSY